MLKRILFIGLIFSAILSTGCYNYYPEPKVIETYETAFLVPMETESDKQVKFASADAYKQYRVATKRIEIPARWKKTGMGPFTGYWMETLRLIKVDRRPVTREWTADPNSGTTTKNEAIWAESQDSIGFSVGITCTARILEEDAEVFLYSYPANTVANVMDSELRARVQQVMSEVSARYDLDQLRSKKSEMSQAIKDDVVPFFKSRGITVTTIGMFGGFTYENKTIQESIDKVFISQQEKNTEKALLEAMESKKSRMLQEGQAEANKYREVARGEADSILMKKTAEADGIKLVTKALEEAKSNPVFLEIKKLEVQMKQAEKWNGDVPRVTFGDSKSGVVPLIHFNAESLNK